MHHEIKDLMTIKDEKDAEFQTESKKLKEEPQREEPFNEETEEETKEKRIEWTSPIPKEKKKFFKYQNGRVIYMEPIKEESNIWKKLKEKVKEKVDTGEKTEPSKNKTIFYGILLVLACIFIYMALHSALGKNENKIYDPAITNKTVATVPTTEEPNVPNVEGTTPEYAINLKEINTKEREKVRDYIAGISNRGAVLSVIERAMSQKMGIYENLGEKSDENSLIVSSLAMSQEFLSSFEKRSVKESLKAVLLKYE